MYMYRRNIFVFLCMIIVMNSDAADISNRSGLEGDYAFKYVLQENDTVTSDDLSAEAFLAYLNCSSAPKSMKFESVVLGAKDLFAPDCILYVDKDKDLLSLHYKELKLDVILPEDLYMGEIPCKDSKKGKICLWERKKSFSMVLSNQ